MHTAAPPSVLEFECLRNQIARVAVIHDPDRWYLGDFLRALPWGAFAASIAPTDLYSDPSYKTLVEDTGLFSAIYAPRALSATAAQHYDLVIVPSAFPPSAVDPRFSRALYSWDSGWLYARYGTVFKRGVATAINAFDRAREQILDIGLPSPRPARIRPRIGEIETTTRHFADIVHGRPVIIYNPTSSNPVTRRTSIPKEVAWDLDIGQHEYLIRTLLQKFPTHHFLIGSALVSGDTQNRSIIAELGRRFAAEHRVSTILRATPDAVSLSGFAALLASPMVEATIGTATGTNTHLAALVGKRSFCLERAVDDEVRATWRRSDAVSTGAIHWRNPSPLAGSVNLRWDSRSRDDLLRAADAFALHLDVGRRGAVAVSPEPATCIDYATDLLRALEGDSDRPVRAALRLSGSLSAAARSIYADVTEELTYLADAGKRYRSLEELDLASADLDDASRQLIRQVLVNSALHRLAQELAPSKPTTPSSTPARILGRLRSAVPLADDQLIELGLSDQNTARQWVANTLRDSVAEVAEDRSGPELVVGWQHRVRILETSVVKRIFTNPASEYLSDEFTDQCIEDVLARGGGLVPPSARVGSHGVVSRRLAMFVAPGGDHAEDHLGGRRVEETHLAAGWVSTHVRHWTALMGQGLFNFDIKFKDTGVNPQGVYLLADFSSTMFLERALAYRRDDRRLSMDRLCVNEIVRNGQFFSRFANGGELVDAYAGAIFEALQFDVRPLMQGWVWGDQESPSADEAAARVRAMMEREVRDHHGGYPAPPLVSDASDHSLRAAVSRRISGS
ncbi:hypothetical protein ACFV9C_41515 [Kribbella sp. NPDC059898]|uniref:hypothetical protein n=1 Tax=Kribbella sp. NPDC059898 TaxID=3346995 RepID=UPI00365DB620